MKFNKTILSVALASAMGITASADAGIVNATWAGAFTMLTQKGVITYNSDVTHCYPNMQLSTTQCSRTEISGSISYDTATRAGAMSINPFSFFGSGFASATVITFNAIGNGDGNPASGNLLLGNMGFNWNGNYGIPVSIVWDGTGLFNAITSGLHTGNIITGVGTNGALPESDNTGGTSPIGRALLATMSWNTSAIGTPALYTNPSGTLPLATDTVADTTNSDLGIGGSPMPTAPFQGFNANFDIMSMDITSCAPDVCALPSVPVPTAVWLFGSGLLGLIGMARRKVA